MIRHNRNGWYLAEFARQMPSGENPKVVEKFVYERADHDGEIVSSVTGYRDEGGSLDSIIFKENFQ